MDTTKRIQLTLFISEDYSEAIEKVRKSYNPIQHALIGSHVTLCREDELMSIDRIRETLRQLKHRPILIQFDLPRRFSDNKGVLIPAKVDSIEFDELRRAVLIKITDQPKKHLAHITLMHPRNSTCTDEIFAAIRSSEYPVQILFNSICLIEQENNKPWVILEKYQLTD